jgi:hypothetical protein
MRSYAITDDMKKGSVEALFDLMAERMVDFAGECGESMHTPEGGEAPILGFCFSFPVDQSALDHGKLIRWTKGAFEERWLQLPLPASSHTRSGAASLRPCQFSSACCIEPLLLYPVGLCSPSDAPHS